MGPESAGADPGPACYGLGGTEPTVTDADLVLGYFNPDYFLGGSMPLFMDKAERAIEEKVAMPLGISTVHSAYGIHDLINEVMAAAAKTHIAEKGGNPRLVTIVAFGGAGPVHAYGLAKKIGASKVLVPRMPGLGSALGFFTAPIAFDVVRSHKVGILDADFQEIERLFQELEREALCAIGPGTDLHGVMLERSVDMRFVGQGSETHVELERRPFYEFSTQNIRALFDGTYRNLYDRTYPEAQLEFVTFKVRGRLPDRPFRLPPLEVQGGSLYESKKGGRLAFSSLKKELVPFEVYDRYRLPPGASFVGPAIIEERESTTVVGEDAKVSVDEKGFLWVEIY